VFCYINESFPNEAIQNYLDIHPFFLIYVHMNKTDTANHIQNIHPAIRGILFILGSLFLFLGIIGIIIPLLPTTPFLLLSAACYLRSSKRIYQWLLNHKWLGVIIKNYYEGKGLPVAFKVFTVLLLWITITISTLYFVSIYWVKIILFIIAILVSIHIITIKTAPSKKN